jgi:hypothetical protein
MGGMVHISELRRWKVNCRCSVGATVVATDEAAIEAHAGFPAPSLSLRRLGGQEVYRVSEALSTHLKG